MAVVALAATAHADTPPTIAKIEARYFYKETGRLSEDLLGRTPPIEGWNALIGEGGAEEYTDDILVTVEITTRGDTSDSSVSYEQPVTITATNCAGTILASRRFNGGLTSHRGVERKALWLPDATCAGEITITARLGVQRRSAKLVMGCGE